MEKLQSVERFTALIAEPHPTIAIFKTSWCSDCHFIDPFMPEVEQKFNEVTFIEVDAEAFEEIAQKYHIMGIPSFVAFKGGKETIRFVNKLRKTQPEIEQFVERAVAVSGAI
ncbi:thioredoxin family protein [Paenibacillus taiwanensis]|uniref:thioredoxin family protein n=1 Tax=Paenibacillus taiwanensis TaxID=401638 RepID=UPI00041C5FBB|nr:thioredoxin family protein [Paenibacillus taiwanensis]